MDAWIAGVLGAAVGGAMGATVAYLWADRRGRAAVAVSETARALAEQKTAGLESERAQAAAAAQRRQDDLAAALKAQQAAAEAFRAQLSELEKQHATATAQLSASKQNIDEQRTLLDEANAKLTAAFAAVSREALERSSATFLEMAKTKFETLSTEAAGNLEQRKAQIETLLKPLQETLGTYQKRLVEIETSRASAYGDLLKHLGGMSETQRALAQQTMQLATALKKSNVRGRWGEIALERLAELSGMTKGVDYELQESLTTEEGARLRPDMVVKMPGNRFVVIDSKAVMDAFLNAAGATDDAARGEFMKGHARNVRSRVDDLSSKAYWSQFTNTPEFVVLFLPGESFLYAACDQDPALIQDAIVKKVLLATPTTLIALLQTIERGWRQELLSKNAEEIRKLGVEIYDRLAILGGNMARLGKSLDGAVDQFNTAVGSLDARLLVSARKMSELGAHSDRDLPELPPVDKKTRELGASLNPEKSPLLPE